MTKFDKGHTLWSHYYGGVMTGLRSRSKEDVHGTYIVGEDSESPWTHSYPSNQVGKSSSITEFCYDNWKSAIKNGTILIGEMQRGVTTRTAHEDSVNEHSSQFGYNVNYRGDIAGLVRNSVPLPPFNTAPSTIRSRARSNAIIDAFAKANGSETFAGETIAQLTETVGMLRHPFSGVTRLVEKVLKRKRRIREAHPLVSGTQALSSAWLEYRYGWKPLMLDIELIMNSIIGLHSQLKRRVVIRGSATESPLEVESSFGVRLPGDFDRWRAFGAMSRTYNVRSRAGVIIDIEPMSTLEMVSKVFGFRCRDLPATLWALTPLSFVADWFSNIEGWIQAVIPDPNVSYRGAWVTTIEKYTSSTGSGTIIGDPALPDINSGAIGTFTGDLLEEIIIVREPNPSVPSHPVLESKLLSLVRQCDGMALSAGRITDLLRNLHSR